MVAKQKKAVPNTTARLKQTAFAHKCLSARWFLAIRFRVGGARTANSLHLHAFLRLPSAGACPAPAGAQRHRA
jgi:hypothetical protein